MTAIFVTWALIALAMLYGCFWANARLRRRTLASKPMHPFRRKKTVLVPVERRKRNVVQVDVVTSL